MFDNIKKLINIVDWVSKGYGKIKEWFVKWQRSRREKEVDKAIDKVASGGDLDDLESIILRIREKRAKRRDRS